MTKEEFLSIKSYKEFDERRSEITGINFSDIEIRNHFNSLFPKPKNSGFEDGIIVELKENKE